MSASAEQQIRAASAARVISEERQISVDAFRGLTIAAMILVNNPGTWSSVYAPLRHATWHGWTPTDLVFPLFLFIMGVSCQYSFANRRGRGENHVRIYLKIIKRTCVLFALGLLINFATTLELEGLRIPGVLQRIAIVYLCSSVIALNFKWRSQAAVMAVFLLAYWAMVALLPVPGYGRGSLTPEGNLAFYLDRVLLTGHIGQSRGDALVVLSTVPAIASALAGTLTGQLLRSGRNKSDIAGWLFVTGWIAIVIGLIWDVWFPINKLIWSSSYVVFTAGAALQLLGLCYFLFDVKPCGRWALPAVIFGSNAILAFVLSTLVYLSMVHLQVQQPGGGTISVREWVYGKLLAILANPYNASLAFAVAYVGFWWLALAALFRRRIFMKV